MICYDKLSIITHQLGDRFSLIGTPVLVHKHPGAERDVIKILWLTLAT